MVLALRTGIAPSAWLAEDDRVIATAWAVLGEALRQVLGPQDAIVARSVRARRDRVPTIQAGGGGKAGRLVYGSEFGMNKRSGWYGARRYRRSAGRQFRPHQGAQGYWFFPAVEQAEGEIGRAWNEAADEIVRKWAR